MPGRHRDVYGGQVTPQPMPGLSSQKVFADGYEQRRLVVWMVAWLVSWMVEWLGVWWMDGCLVDWLDGWLGGWVDGGLNGCLDGG